ncbi:MAG: alpha-xylosidase [Alteromonadaceae bacterium]|nr:alpha-xylosidase [Alteromonadaceae bacterium]
MTDFAVSVPPWNDIWQLNISASATISESGSVVLPTEQGDMIISVYANAVRFQLGEQRTYDYKMIKMMPVLAQVDLVSDAEHTVITSQNITVNIGHHPFTFDVIKDGRSVQRTPNDGHFVRQFRIPPMAKLQEGWLCSFDLFSNEPVYGLGEKWGRLNKRGQLVRSFNHDALGVNAEISYKNTPFCWSPEGWGVFVHTPAPVTHSVGYALWSQRAYGVLVEDDELDIFLFCGDSPSEIIDQYTQLTGKAPTPPDWSLGVILSKAYYKDVPELLETARQVRAQGMPCDTITLDGRAWQDTDTRFAFEWDPKRYDDPAEVIAELKAMNFKVCVWEYPLVSEQNKLFDEMAEKGWLIKDRRTGLPFRYQWDISAFGEVLTPLPQSGIVDFTHPEAYEFWLESHAPLFELGVDMIKADFGEQIEDPHMIAHNGECGTALHNVYSMLYNRCVYEAAKKYCKTGPFLFSRSAWTGQQCFPAQWGGDPQADWGGLAANIRGGISWGLSGAPFYATDVGGFYKDTRDSELFVRWTQAGVFSAHMRLHGIGQREPWSYSKEAELAANKALELRYKLLPYIHETMLQSSETGIPVQRAMVLAFPDDPAAWNFEDQFMFGDKMLVAPAYRPGGKVEVYLPEGDWVWFETKQAFAGGKVHRLQCALDQIAVFVRKGDVIPMTEAREHIDGVKIHELPVSEWAAK